MIQYNKEKVKQAIQYLLSIDHALSYREILQYLFLIDVYFYKNFKTSFTNDTYIKTNEGTILKQTLYHLFYTFEFSIKKTYHIVRNTLNNNEMCTIQTIYNKHRALTRKDYIKMCNIEKPDMLINIRDVFVFWEYSANDIKKIKYDIGKL